MIHALDIFAVRMLHEIVISLLTHQLTNSHVTAVITLYCVAVNTVRKLALPSTTSKYSE